MVRNPGNHRVLAILETDSPALGASINSYVEGFRDGAASLIKKPETPMLGRGPVRWRT
jgi:hypothetical protein